MRFLLSGLLSLSTICAAPSIFWMSSPVLPGEAVYIQGHELEPAVRTEYARLSDNPVDTSTTAGVSFAPAWTTVKPLQTSGSSLQFALPPSLRAGAYMVRITGADGTSLVKDLNIPEIWWTQGEQGKGRAYQGGWLRIFGRALQLDPSRPAAFQLRSGERVAHHGLLPARGDGYSLAVDLPADLAAASYTIWVHNGFGGAEGWRSAGEVNVAARPVWPDRRFDVTSFGALPNDDGDDAAGIQAALDAAGTAGGGEVYIPRGRYMVSAGLTVPLHVTLRGERMEFTALQWYDYGVGEPKSNAPAYVKKGEPPVALIRGDAHFRIQDLTLYSWSHYHGILAQHWKGEGNVHLARVRTRLNETSVNLGRFYASKEGESDAEFREFQARRERRKGMWTASFQAGGPNISVENCDFEDNGFGIIIDNGEGVVIRNSRFYSAFSKGTHAMILEDNKLHEFWPGTHDSFEDPLRRRGKGAREPNPSTQHLYMARNSSKNADGDREPSSLDSHGPFGRYIGPVASVQGAVLTLAKVSADGQKLAPSAPVGFAAYILDGKGAGQYRRVVGGTGSRLELDRPFEVQPDATSVVSIAKYHGELLYIDNDFTDTGDVQIWGGAINTVFKGTKLTRTGGFNQAGGYIFGGVIPIWYLEQIDTHVIEGNSPGGPPFQLRAAHLSMNTYRHAEFYQGPCVMGAILRRVVAEDNTSIDITGAVRGVLIEHSLLKNNDRGIIIQGRASYYNNPTIEKERRAPSDVVLRANRFENIIEPYAGDEAKKFPPLP